MLKGVTEVFDGFVDVRGGEMISGETLVIESSAN